MDHLNEKPSKDGLDTESKAKPKVSTGFDAELERILAEDWHTGTVPVKPAEAEKPAEPVKPADPVVLEETAPREIPQEIPAVKETEEPVVHDIPKKGSFTVENPAVSAEEGEELSEEEEEDDEAEEDEDAPLQKRRPKRKPGYGLLGIPHILSTVIWLALIVAIGVSFARVLWVCCADVMAFGKENKSVTIFQNFILEFL